MGTCKSYLQRTGTSGDMSLADDIGFTDRRIVTAGLGSAKSTQRLGVGPFTTRIPTSSTRRHAGKIIPNFCTALRAENHALRARSIAQNVGNRTP